MINLIIKEVDGSVYWTECFDAAAAAEAWLKEEQSRPYWVEGRTFEIVDNSKEEKAKKDAADKAAQARALVVSEAASAIRKHRSRRDRTLAEANDLLDQIINYLGI